MHSQGSLKLRHSGDAVPERVSYTLSDQLGFIIVMHAEKRLQLSLTSQYRWTAVVEGALMRVLSEYAAAIYSY